ncbi:MAG: CAP domain-containing protein, partial [Acidimicrobiia bacterium]|nr:CAP domain-containing protein [Acidimicrobiia bacterium]
MRRSARLLLVAVALLLAPLAVLSPAAAAASAGVESDLLVLLNKQRASAGLQPLVLDGSLSSVARSWSVRMAADGLAHNPSLRAAIEGSVTRNWSRLGENVGVGGSAPSLHRAFWDSPGHRANIVGGYNRVGIGAVATGSTLWVTFDFVQGPAVAGPTGLVACRAGGYLLEADGTVQPVGGAAPLPGGGRW